MRHMILVLAVVLVGCAGAPPRVEEVDWSIPIASVVRITQFGMDGRPVGRGSGVVIAPKLVLTAAHVTDVTASGYEIRSIGGFLTSGVVKLRSFDGSDWALMELAEPVGVPCEVLGRGEVVPGLWPVAAIGFAAGIESPTVTFGHLQPAERGLYRITAPIAPGNSGGGAFSLVRGRPVLIGLTVAVLAPGVFACHLGLVVPVDRIRSGGGIS